MKTQVIPTLLDIQHSAQAAFRQEPRNNKPNLAAPELGLS